MTKINSAIATSFFFLLVIALLTSCASSSKVVKYLNEDANFRKYHTYKIINFKVSKADEEYSQQGNALVDSVEAYITNEMKSKGYRKELRSDLLVRYELISGVETNVSRNTGYYGGFNSYYNPYDPYNNRTRATRSIEGILLLEIKERKSRKLVWQGSLDLKYSRRKKVSNLMLIKDAITEIYTTYPYRAGKGLPVNTSK